ncbi:MAG: hypothetical protein LAQ30_17130 [Acidobacteriia bacterium]|nr:hypothetical protein [Terriglobia bacterium]
MRLVGFLILGVALACGAAPAPFTAQEQEKTAAPKNGMFSGTVSAISEGSLTVTGAGGKESKTFAITPDTRFEGPRPEVKSRVDIRFVSTDAGDRAVRVIVRGPAKK